MEENTLCMLVRALRTDYTEKKLSADVKQAVAAHLDACPACRAAYETQTTDAPEKEPVMEFSPDETLPIAQFLKKRKQRRTVWISLLSGFLCMVLLLCGVSLYTYVSRGIVSMCIVSGADANGYFYPNDGGGARRVTVRYQALYTAFPLGNETDSVSFSALSAADENGDAVVSFSPYPHTVLWPMPAKVDTDDIASILIACNDRDLSESTYLGNFYAFDRCSSFLLYMPGEDGYLLSFGAEAEALIARAEAELDLPTTVLDQLTEALS